MEKGRPIFLLKLIRFEKYFSQDEFKHVMNAECNHNVAHEISERQHFVTKLMPNKQQFCSLKVRQF